MAKFISARNKINARLEQSLPGSILFAQDFFGEASSEAVRQQLSRLVREGALVRIAQGIYASPKKVNGKPLLPAAPEIANAIARRDKAKIIPTGEVALSQLGLSEQVPLNFVYLTDGPTRVIKIENSTGRKGYSIKFKHAGPKNFAYTGKISGPVIQALRALRKKELSDKTKDKVKSLLMREDQADLRHDMALAPAWISKLLLDLLKN
jgi:hypothetical protein